MLIKLLFILLFISYGLSQNLLYGQYPDYTTVTAPSNIIYNGSFDGHYTKIADDFTIPSSEQWTISSITIYGTVEGEVPKFWHFEYYYGYSISAYYNNYSPIPNEGPLSTYMSNPVIEGDMITFDMTPVFGGPLYAGTHYICFYASTSYNNTLQGFQWKLRGSTSTNPFAIFQDPDSIFGPHDVWILATNTTEFANSRDTTFAIYGQSSAAPTNNFGFPNNADNGNTFVAIFLGCFVGGSFLIIITVLIVVCVMKKRFGWGNSRGGLFWSWNVRRNRPPPVVTRPVVATTTTQYVPPPRPYVQPSYPYPTQQQQQTYGDVDTQTFVQVPYPQQYYAPPPSTSVHPPPYNPYS